MTIFSNVTATLSPEFAFCVKAKGKTWKDKFFDSLKSLVGVDYTIYRKENQWQIRGEWEAIKKAYSILEKVANIEKDSISALQNENAKDCGSELHGSSNLFENGIKQTRKSRSKNIQDRGKTSRNTDSDIKHIDNQESVETTLQPKRKRGRPRKVPLQKKIIQDVNDTKDGVTYGAGRNEKNNQDTNFQGKQESSEGLTDLNPKQIEICPINISNVDSDGNNEIVKSENSTGLISEFDNPSNQDSKNENNQTKTVIEDLKVEQANLCDENTITTTSENSPGISLEHSVASDNNVIETSNETMIKDLIGENSQCKVDCNKDESNMSTKETKDDPSHVFSPETDDTIHAVDTEVKNLEENSQNLHLSVSKTSELDVDENKEILDYLGIKNKLGVEDFSDDNDRHSNEQNKKLEELIEKMIEKMDQSISDVSKSSVSAGLKYICTECPFTSPKKVQLREHMSNEHKKIEELSLEEGQVTNESLVLDSKVPDKKISLLKTPLKCKECSYSTKSRKHLKEHRLRKHIEKTLECGVCNKKFAVSRDLARHMKEHSRGNNLFSCKICGRKYKQSYVLKRHEETHKDGYVKPMFPCTLCSKAFSAKQVLVLHMDSVHLGKKQSFPCEVCDKKFTTKHSLAEHQLIHSNTKPYKCAICCKSFRHESTLKTHERLHTDASQTFTCEYCGKAFRLRSSLRIHRNIHTGDKRFECPVCKKVFTQKQSLLRHARIHTGEKPFQCEICGSSFYDYSILRRHVTGVHKMQWKSPTQHYVLPPDNYKDGRVIDAKPNNEVPFNDSQIQQFTSSQTSASHVLNIIPSNSDHSDHTLGQQTPPLQTQLHLSNQIYQPSPLPHTPQTVAQPNNLVDPMVSVQNLTTQPMQNELHIHQEAASQHSSHQHQSSIQHIELKSATTPLPSQGITYHHTSVVPSNTYHDQNIPLTSTVPISVALSQNSPLQTLAPQQEQQHQTPPPAQHSLSTPVSPMTTMSLGQFHQPSPQTSNSTLQIQAAFTLTQHHFYQSHH